MLDDIFSDYFWKEGKPVGHGRLAAPDVLAAPVAYKIIKDPYQKHISIERYRFGQFAGLVYDSLLLDFRHLKPANQKGWKKEVILDSLESTVCLIRNLDDRVILQETYTFDNALCLKCETASPHGILLSLQKMYYAMRGDGWNGVMLFDSAEHPVMRKEYQCDAAGLFTTLTHESWVVKPTLA